jgi:DNA-binding HxlR family transcriptional regulator
MAIKERLRGRGLTSSKLEHSAANCRAHEMLERVGDKWSAPMIYLLGVEGTLRFGEILQRIPRISQRMLTVTLRGLERDGLVRRTMYPEVPPRVEYTLTPLGKTLREIVRALVDWSGAHLLEVDAARARFDNQVRGWAATQGVDIPVASAGSTKLKQAAVSAKRRPIELSR